jgi:hypothetical protein
MSTASSRLRKIRLWRLALEKRFDDKQNCIGLSCLDLLDGIERLSACDPIYRDTFTCSLALPVSAAASVTLTVRVCLPVLCCCVFQL